MKIEWNTVTSFVSEGITLPSVDIVVTQGFNQINDGGAIKLQRTGQVGAPSQTFINTGSNTCTDANGDEWEISEGTVIEFNGIDDWFGNGFGSNGKTAYTLVGGTWADKATSLEQRLVDPLGGLFKGTGVTNGERHVQLGDTVPAGTTAITAFIDGRTVNLILLSAATGSITSIDSYSVTIGNSTVSACSTQESTQLRSIAAANNTSASNVAFLYDGTVLTGQEYLRVASEEKTYFVDSGVTGTVSDSGTDVNGIRTISTVSNGDFVAVIPERLKSSGVFKHSAPAIPTFSDSPKLIFRPASESGFYVVSRRSRSRGGYVMTLVRDDVATADTNNLGGSAITHPNIVNNLTDVFVANSVAHSYSANTAILDSGSRSQDFIDDVWGFSDSGSNFSYYAESEDATENSLQNRKLYDVISGTGTDSVTFRVRGDAVLRMGCSLTSSETVKISLLSDDETYEYDLDTISLRQDPSGTVSMGREYKIETPETSVNSFYKIKVTNTSTNVNEHCYVAGVNILRLNQVCDETFITNALCLRSASNPKYRNSTGANEVAMRELGGKFFGTFHGGHAITYERLRVGNGTNYDVQADAVPSLLVTTHATLISISDLTPESATCVYQYNVTYTFHDGADVAKTAINVKSGTSPILSDCYTHMCTTFTDFDFVMSPNYIANVTAQTNTPLYNSGYIEQYNGSLTISCTFSEFDNLTYNEYGSPYIQCTANFNKQYYGPILNIPSKFNGGTFITTKEYY